MAIAATSFRRHRPVDVLFCLVLWVCVSLYHAKPMHSGLFLGPSDCIVAKLDFEEGVGLVLMA